MNRRSFLAGIVITTSAMSTATACAANENGYKMTTGSDRFGNPRIPAELNTQVPHVYRLGKADPATFDGGTIRQANETTFPILSGQEAAAVLIELEPGAIREPHWHPSAWEVNFVVTGTARWSFLEPEAYHEGFDVETGDVVFAPQGSLHYFENPGNAVLRVLAIFNTSAVEGRDDIGLGSSITAMPPTVLASLFGVPTEVFSTLPYQKGSKPIFRHG